MTTFADLIAVADTHHAALADALNHPTIRQDAAHPASVAELVRLLDVLARYHHKIATGFGTTLTPDDYTQHAAQRSAHLITEARTTLTALTTSNPPSGPDLAWTLRATSQTLGASLDLLSTHAPTGISTQPAPSEATVLASTDTARALLHLLARHTTTAAHLALAAGPSAHDAGATLLRTALVQTLHGDPAPATVNAIALNQSPPRRPPATGEDRAEALHGLAGSTERLRLAEPTHAVDTWHYLAGAAAITCALSEHLARILGRRLRELDQPQAATALLTPIAYGIRGLSYHWRFLFRAWRNISPPSTRNSELAIDASDLVLRLGRLLHTDPAWKPGPTAAPRIRLTTDLAPTLEDATHIGLAILKTLETWNTFAQHPRTAANDLLILRYLENTTSLRNKNHSIHAIFNRYHIIHKRGTTALTKLGNTLLPITLCSSSINQQISLITHRNPTPVIRPSTDFPTPITEALGTTPRSRARSDIPAAPNRGTHQESGRLGII